MSLISKYGAGARAREVSAATIREVLEAGTNPATSAPGEAGTNPVSGAELVRSSIPAPAAEVRDDGNRDELEATAAADEIRAAAEWREALEERAPAPSEAAELAHELREVREHLEGATARVLERIDAGYVPYNAVTGTAYRGKNVDRFLAAELEHGYGAGGWAGFGQWLRVGRVVRKGEHGTAGVTVTGAGKGESSSSSEAAGEAAESSSKGKRGKGGGVRGFRVFHFDQTTELER